MPANSSAIPAPTLAAAPSSAVRMVRGRWLAVGGLVLLALALRLGYLYLQLGPEYRWYDADAYLAKGASLVAGGSFRWSYDAVAYPWGGKVYALPPLFSIYLAPFAYFPSYPFNAFVGLAVLNALAIPLVVAIGARLHSWRAGLIAAFLYACWGSDIVGQGQVRQEPLYLPLVIAATLALIRAWQERGLRAFALAGAAFGLAALCRSMPIYYVGVAAVIFVLYDRKGAGPRQALALIAGFAALTLPYSVALSLHLKQPTLIENHGGILVAARYMPGGRTQVPGLGGIISAIAREVTKSPTTFAQVTFDQGRSLLPLTGGRFLQDGVFAATAADASKWKLLAHAFIDAPWLLALVLAPLGAALARSKPAVAFIAGWALLNIALTALTGFGGSRLRCPFEVHVALLGAVALAGGWTRPRPLVLGLGVAGSVVAALLMVSEVSRTAGGRANYGPRWTLAEARTTARVTGGSGANVLTTGKGVDVALTNPGPAPIRVALRVDDARLIEGAVIDPGASRAIAVQSDRTGLLFVEVDATTSGGQPAPVDVQVDRR